MHTTIYTSLSRHQRHPVLELVDDVAMLAPHATPLQLETCANEAEMLVHVMELDVFQHTCFAIRPRMLSA